MRLIDADEFEAILLKNASPTFDAGVLYALNTLDKAPTVDAVPVVRCKKCKHAEPINTEVPPFRYFNKECVWCICEEVIGDDPMVYQPDRFCSHGERKSDNE